MILYTSDQWIWSVEENWS